MSVAIETLNPKTAGALMTAVIAAVKETAEKFGVVIKPAGGSIDPNGFSMTAKLKVEIDPSGLASKAVARFAKDKWNMYCEQFGFLPSEYGATFDTPRGRRTLAGFAPGNPKNPVLMTDDAGKQWRSAPGFVRKYLQAPAAVDRKPARTPAVSQRNPAPFKARFGDEMGVVVGDYVSFKRFGKLMKGTVMTVDAGAGTTTVQVDGSSKTTPVPCSHITVEKAAGKKRRGADTSVDQLTESKLQIDIANIEIGDTVHWKAAGKVARAEGTAGHVVFGKVTNIDDQGRLHVMPNHRLSKKAAYSGMGAIVGPDAVVKVEKGAGDLGEWNDVIEANAANAAKRKPRRKPRMARTAEAPKKVRATRNRRTAKADAPKLTAAEKRAKAERAAKRAERKAKREAAARKEARAAKRTARTTRTSRTAAKRKPATRTTRAAKPAAKKVARRNRMG